MFGKEAMNQDTNKKIKWTVAMVTPGEDELSLLASLTSRQDARVIAIVDPEGQSVGAGLAEILGISVVPDLESLPEKAVRFVVHPPLNDTIAEILDPVIELGLTPVSAENFSNLLVDQVLNAASTHRSSTSRVNFDFLETETSAIHETLGRIEEALDREALLRWLLKLATKASGASSGSIMLFDETTQELYVAFAHGLSMTTLHRTRVKMGEGVSGRVATTGKAEIIRGNRSPLKNSDRSHVKSSICAPLMWQDQLLGILNISTNDGDPELSTDALAVVENLSQRFGLILNRFLRLQTVRDGEKFRKMEEDLTYSSMVPEPVNSTLCDWAENLADVTGADYLSISILTADGDLLVADAEDVHYESPPAPEKDAVLASGSPLVLRPSCDGSSSSEHPSHSLGGNGLEEDCTVFHLPIGRGSTRSLLTVVFDTPSRAHHFHSISAETIFLVNRHLATYLEKSQNSDQMDRLTSLASCLSSLSTLEPDDSVGLSKRAVAAACQLTGAQQACIMSSENKASGCLEGQLDTPLHKEVVRLLLTAGKAGWKSTILDVDRAPGATLAAQSILVVPLSPSQPFPGLVLLNKKRLHPLDGASFTEFDALFARRLLPVFHARQNHATSTAVSAIELPVETNVSLNIQPAESVTANQVPEIDIQTHLSQEIDRCKRYHSMVGIAVLKVTPATGTVPDLNFMVSGLQNKLRSSDRAGLLPDGTILVVVPEDIKSLPHLLKRLSGILVELSGQEDLFIQTSSKVYPGGGKNAQELIYSALSSLS